MSDPFFALPQTIPDEEPVSHPALPPSDTASSLRLHWILPETVHRNTVFHLLLLGGNNRAPAPRSSLTLLPLWRPSATLCPLLFPGHQGSVSVCQGSEEAVVEVSHQVHDVVPEARGAQDYHWRVWAGALPPPPSRSAFPRWSIQGLWWSPSLHINGVFVSPPGYLHLLWLWEMGPEEEGGVYLWVQVPWRQRPAVIDTGAAGKNKKRTETNVLLLTFRDWTSNCG